MREQMKKQNTIDRPLFVQLIQLMATTKAKIGIAGALLAVGIATPLVLQQKANARLRLEIDNLRQQTQQFARLREENQELARFKVEADARQQELARVQDELRRLKSGPQTRVPDANLDKDFARSKFSPQQGVRLRNRLVACSTDWEEARISVKGSVNSIDK
jgi:hypothetical protein